MIQLDQYEKQWILLIKGHLQEKYPYKGRWVDILKPLFTEIYSWNPDEDNNYHDYLRGIFNKLLDIQLKIKDNWSDSNGQLKEIFFASFYVLIKSFSEASIKIAHCFIIFLWNSHEGVFDWWGLNVLIFLFLYT